VLAHDERNTHHDRMAINAKAIKESDQYRLQGHKCVLAHAMSADLFLVSVMLEERLCVFGVPRAMPGLRLVPCPLADGTLAADLFLDDVMLPASAMLGDDEPEGTDASAAVSAALDRGLAAVCSEAVGALDKLMAATAEYTRNRKQFGVAIGSFQALRHRMAEMLMHTEQARSMSYLAAVRCTDPDLAQRERALSAAKVIIGQACRFVAQQAVQLHGGMGVTDELNISHYFKRLMVIEMQFGSTDHHLQAFAAKLA
jgi:alkylation response protein AidB-like acyl-CoA dehydrogenase